MLVDLALKRFEVGNKIWHEGHGRGFVVSTEYPEGLDKRSLGYQWEYLVQRCPVEVRFNTGQTFRYSGIELDHLPLKRRKLTS